MRKVAIILLFSLALVACLLSCASQAYRTTISINRPIDEVESAIAKAEAKLGTFDAAGDPFALPGLFLKPGERRSEGGWTSFELPPGSYPEMKEGIELQKRALLEELYRAEGKAVPASAKAYATKDPNRSLALYFVNLGWMLDYSFKDNLSVGAGFYEERKSMTSFIAVADALSLLGAAGFGLASLIAPKSEDRATYSHVAMGAAIFWGAFKVGCLPLALVGSQSCSLHDRLLDAGYNWDPAFRVEAVSDLRYRERNVMPEE